MDEKGRLEFVKRTSVSAALERLKALASEVGEEQERELDQLKVLDTNLLAAEERLERARGVLGEAKERLVLREAELTMQASGKNEKERTAAARKLHQEDPEYQGLQNDLRRLAGETGVLEAGLNSSKRQWRAIEMKLSRGIGRLPSERRYLEKFVEVIGAILTFMGGKEE